MALPHIDHHHQGGHRLQPDPGALRRLLLGSLLQSQRRRRLSLQGHFQAGQASLLHHQVLPQEPEERLEELTNDRQDRPM